MNNTNDTKILFTDLDGTLLGDDHKASANSQNAIRRCLDAGHKIVITTGRPVASAKLLAKELHLTDEGCYVIASNGAVLYDAYNQKVLSEITFPLAYVRTLLDSAYEEGLHAHTYSHTNVISERDTPEIRWYEKTIRVPALIVEDATTYLPYDPVKVILINAQSRNNLVRFQKKMEEWANGKVNSIFSSDIMLEYCPIGVSKGNAVVNLCNLLDIPIENSIAAGDAENDISMLKAAGVGCAMCNGSDETKAAADYITIHSNNEDGFVEIVEQFML